MLYEVLPRDIPVFAMVWSKNLECNTKNEFFFDFSMTSLEGIFFFFFLEKVKKLHSLRGDKVISLVDRSALPFKKSRKRKLPK